MIINVSKSKYSWEGPAIWGYLVGLVMRDGPSPPRGRGRLSEPDPQQHDKPPIPVPEFHIQAMQAIQRAPAASLANPQALKPSSRPQLAGPGNASVPARPLRSSSRCPTWVYPRCWIRSCSCCCSSPWLRGYSPPGCVRPSAWVGGEEGRDRCVCQTLNAWDEGDAAGAYAKP
jgi:hypothetical protein